MDYFIRPSIKIRKSVFFRCFDGSDFCGNIADSGNSLRFRLVFASPKMKNIFPHTLGILHFSYELSSCSLQKSHYE